jgi:hypothetical protein
LLRHALTRRIGNVSLDASFTLKLWVMAFVSAAIGYLPKLVVMADHPIMLAVLSLPLYGMSYFASTFFLGINEAEAALRRVISRVGRR